MREVLNEAVRLPLWEPKAEQSVAHGLGWDIDERHLPSQRFGEALRHLGMGERLRTREVVDLPFMPTFRQCRDSNVCVVAYIDHADLRVTRRHVKGVLGCNGRAEI